MYQKIGEIALKCMLSERRFLYNIAPYLNQGIDGMGWNYLSQACYNTMEQRKLIFDKFQEHLEKSFSEYCKRHRLEGTHHNFLTYIIDQNLITLPYLQRFTVIREYEQLKEEEQYPKTLLVDTLAHRFSISERTIWGILKNVKDGKTIKKRI